MAHKYHSPRETRSLSRFLNNNCSDMTPENHSRKAPQKAPKQVRKHKPFGKMAQSYKSMAHQPRSDDSSDSLDEGASVAGEAVEGSSDNDEDDESEAFAPSGYATKRIGHQTGLLTIQNRDDDLDSAGSWDESLPSPVAEHEASIEQYGSDDDDIYRGVDFISDSEEDEPTMERIEEDLIIQSMEMDENMDSQFVGPASPALGQSWSGFDQILHSVSHNDIPVLYQMEHRNKRLTFDDLYDENFASSPYVAPTYESSPTGPQRRVHFADEIEGQALFEEADSIDFGLDTDMFVLRESLSERLARTPEDGNDDDAPIYQDIGSSDPLGLNDQYVRRVYCQTPGPNGPPTPTESPVQSSLDLEAGGGYSSGYETDDGEETADEMIPPTTVHQPQALLHLRSNSSTSNQAAALRATNFSHSRVSKDGRYRRGPRLGTFAINIRKHVGFIDQFGKVQVEPPFKTDDSVVDLASNKSSSVPPSPNNSLVSIGDTDAASQERGSRKVGVGMDNRRIGSETDLVLDLFQTALGPGYVYNGDLLGPAEAFFSLDGHGPEASTAAFVDPEMSDDDLGEDVLNVADFIDFGDPSSDDETAATKPLSPSSSQENRPSAIASGKAADNSCRDLLGHLEKAARITAFRRNQDRIRYTQNNSARRAFKGPSLGTASLSPKSPIKSTVRQRKEKIPVSHTRSHSYFGTSGGTGIHTSHRRIRST